MAAAKKLEKLSLRLCVRIVNGYIAMVLYGGEAHPAILGARASAGGGTARRAGTANVKR